MGKWGVEVYIYEERTGQGVREYRGQTGSVAGMAGVVELRGDADLLDQEAQAMDWLSCEQQDPH